MKACRKGARRSLRTLVRFLAPAAAPRMATHGVLLATAALAACSSETEADRRSDAADAGMHDATYGADTHDDGSPSAPDAAPGEDAPDTTTGPDGAHGGDAAPDPDAWHGDADGDASLPLPDGSSPDDPSPDDPCDDLRCAPGGSCDPSTATCACDVGWVATALGCEAVSRCDGAPDDDTDEDHARDTADEPGCATDCDAPRTLRLDAYRDGFAIEFTHHEDLLVRHHHHGVGMLPWMRAASTVVSPAMGPRVVVEARAHGPECTLPATIDAARAPHWPGPVGSSTTTALALDDPRIAGWAASVGAVTWGERVSERWRTLDNALGPASGDVLDVVSLGDGGTLALAFDGVLFDGEGPDFAVFENAFNDTFLELAFVEVSTDGEHWARFDTIYEGPAVDDPFLDHDPRTLHGFAGKYRGGWGVPYDLALLIDTPEVRAGHVDLDLIRWVRIVDIAGDGREEDSRGTPIYDAYPTRDSAGFDLDGVAALHLRDEP